MKRLITLVGIGLSAAIGYYVFSVSQRIIKHTTTLGEDVIIFVWIALAILLASGVFSIIWKYENKIDRAMAIIAVSLPIFITIGWSYLIYTDRVMGYDAYMSRTKGVSVEAGGDNGKSLGVWCLSVVSSFIMNPFLYFVIVPYLTASTHGII